MYIDWQSKKIKTTLRFIFYGILTTLTITTTIALVYISKGYWFDGKTGKVTQSGLLLVGSHPVRATIKINDKTFNKTPGRYVLLAGQHDLSLSAPDYRIWQKNIKITGSAVKQVYYPRLFPKEIKSTSVISIKQPEIYSMSNNQKNILLRDKNNYKNLVIIYPIKSFDKPIEVSWPVDLPKNGNIELIEWSSDSSKVLLKHTHKKQTSYLQVDIKNSKKVNNLTAITKMKLADVHFSGKSGSFLYAIVNQNLFKFDITKLNSSQSTIKAGSLAPPTKLLSKVIDYKPYGDNLILFSQQNIKKTQVGIFNIRDSESKIIHTEIFKPDTRFALGYNEFLDKQYFVVSSSAAPKVWIYTNPLESSNDIPLKPAKILQASGKEGVKFSDNGQFVMFQNNHKFTIYDFDEKQTYKYEAQVDINNQVAQWMDDARIIVNIAGKIYVWDYDNTNLQMLGDTNYNTPALFSNNFINMWTVNHNAANKSYDLRLSSLSASKTPESLLKSTGTLF